MNRADLVKTILLHEQLAAASRDRAAAARAELTAQAAAEYEREGMAPSWKLPDVGRVVLPTTEATPVVTDEAALLKWVAHRFPGEIEEILQIRPAFAAALTKALIVDGDLVVFPETGEVVDGYTVRPGGVARSLTITPTAEAKGVARLYAEGLLDRFAADLTGGG